MEYIDPRFMLPRGIIDGSGDKNDLLVAISYKDALAISAELGGETLASIIDWSNAPQWAKYIAKDGGGGNWYWYEYMPIRMSDYWDALEGMYLCCEEQPDLFVDWEESLMENPNKI